MSNETSRRLHDALVVGAPCAGSQHGGNIYGQRTSPATPRRRSVRGGRQNPAAQCGLVCKHLMRTHQTAGRDLGRWISQTCVDAARSRLWPNSTSANGRDESRAIRRQPPSAATGLPISESRHPAARVSWISINASAGRSNGSMSNSGQGRDRRWSRRNDQGGRRSALAVCPKRVSPFDIDNVSVTRLDHFASADHSSWRLPWSISSPGS